jgi:hypothetical protein
MHVTTMVSGKSEAYEILTYGIYLRPYWLYGEEQNDRQNCQANGPFHFLK